MGIWNQPTGKHAERLRVQLGLGQRVYKRRERVDIRIRDRLQDEIRVVEAAMVRVGSDELCGDVAIVMGAGFEYTSMSLRRLR